ncbi:mismatch-specific DNA-glycosylase [Chondrinema litorale]|uniref:mismatch-specific DNA-glycosylase n=1 Tax=Chondrinema litorale TaxID=2994555 RepID=UPI0025428FBF|nr:mismatch-specific DNA-glycosylase [Chondrinema litorale]UZR93134.1 mismatch-specific DNA-glycosylase [Chondrinema litorale]
MLKDVLDTNLDVVFCGTAKGKASALKGFYYAGPGNKFYSILCQTGFTPHKLDPKECYEINKYNIGLTDLVHTEFGNDKEISNGSYEVESFIIKMEKYQPKYIAFNSKKAASFVLGYQGKTTQIKYGLQEKNIGESKLFVLPSTSGNARRFWNENYWLELKQLIAQA